MGCLLTKYEQLKHDKCQIYIEILRILDTYQCSCRAKYVLKDLLQLSTRTPNSNLTSLCRDDLGSRLSNTEWGVSAEDTLTL